MNEDSTWSGNDFLSLIMNVQDRVLGIDSCFAPLKHMIAVSDEGEWVGFSLEEVRMTSGSYEA